MFVASNWFMKGFILFWYFICFFEYSVLFGRTSILHNLWTWHIYRTTCAFFHRPKCCQGKLPIYWCRQLRLKGWPFFLHQSVGWVGMLFEVTKLGWHSFWCYGYYGRWSGRFARLPLGSMSWWKRWWHQMIAMLDKIRRFRIYRKVMAKNFVLNRTHIF